MVWFIHFIHKILSAHYFLQCLHLQNRDDHSLGFVLRIKELEYGRHLEQCLAHSECSVVLAVIIIDSQSICLAPEREPFRRRTV